MPEAKPTPPDLTAPERAAVHELHAAWVRDPDQFALTVLERCAALPGQTGDCLARAVGVHLLEVACSVATAESCSGGGIGSALTAVAGSSAWVEGGVISYSNASKTLLLGVPAELIARHGAVSLPVARAMALGAQARLGTACSVAVSGIAGPGGATPGKPVGTVCLAWTGVAHPSLDAAAVSAVAADRQAVEASAPAPLGIYQGTTPFAQTLWFPGDRAAVRAATVLVALVGLLGVRRPRSP